MGVSSFNKQTAAANIYILALSTCLIIGVIYLALLLPKREPIVTKYDLISISKENSFLSGDYYNLTIKSKDGQIINLNLFGNEIFEDAVDKSYVIKRGIHYTIHLTSAKEIK